MVNTPAYANSSSWFATAIETTPGTPATTPSYWIPVKSPKIQPVITEVMDDSLRGSMVTNYNQIPTVRHDEYTFTCLCYLSTLPMLVRSILGSPDTIVGTVAPYSHTFSLLNNAPTTANRGPTYTFFDYDGYVVRQMAAGVVDELSIKFTATGLIELTVKVVANPFSIRGGAIPATSFDAIEAAPSWACTPTINSLAYTTLVEAEVNLKRGAKPIHTMGTQAPYVIQPGPLQIDGKMTVINQTDVELGWYLNDSIVPVNFAFAPPKNAVDTITIDMLTCKFANANQERGGDELIITSTDIIPLPNSTDATAGGVSPIKITCLTSQATTY